MKRILTILLVVTMACTLLACGAKEENAGLQETTQTETTVPETEETPKPQFSEDMLFDSWTEMSGYLSIVFKNDGNCVLKYESGEELELGYQFADTTVTLNVGEQAIKFEVVEQDGIYHLITDAEGEQLDFILTTDYNSLVTVEEIELTVDNWKDYFELVPVENWEENGFGEAEGYRVNYILQIRENIGKIQRTVQPITVELSYSAHYYNAKVDLENRVVETSGVVSNVSGEETGDVKKVVDAYLDSNIGESSNGGFYLSGVGSYLIKWDNGERTLYLIDSEPDITRIKGTICVMSN